MSALNNFVKHLKELHEKDKSFVGRLAAGLKSSRSYAHKVVMGKQEPGLARAEEIAQLAGTSLLKIIGDEAPEYAAPRPLTETEAALFVMQKLGISGDRLELVRFVLEGAEPYVAGLVRELPKLSSGAGKRSQRSTS